MYLSPYRETSSTFSKYGEKFVQYTAIEHLDLEVTTSRLTSRVQILNLITLNFLRVCFTDCRDYMCRCNSSLRNRLLYASSTILLQIFPIPSISISTLSPFFSQFKGLKNAATPLYSLAICLIPITCFNKNLLGGSRHNHCSFLKSCPSTQMPQESRHSKYKARCRTVLP